MGKMRSKVVIIGCEGYNFNELVSKIHYGIELAGGIERFFKKGEKILLKPNLLKASLPEKCVTTHPLFFKAVAKVLRDFGVQLVYGDSPGFGKPEKVAQRAGLKEVADEMGIPFVDFENGKEVFASNTYRSKRLFIANGVLEADGIVSLPKFKTHQLTGITCAVKNQLGCIPGLKKAELHVIFSNPESFSQMLIDLNLIIKPRLYIVDAIDAMEGNGPGAGKRYNLGLIVISDDPVAIDSVLSYIVNIDPQEIPTNKWGEILGLGVSRLEDIEVIGDSIENFRTLSFNTSSVSRIGMGNLASIPFLRRLLIRKPVVDHNRCKKCGICINQCSVDPKAINWVSKNGGKFLRFDYNLCIGCFCCQEACPFDAIYVKTPILNRILDWIG